MLGSAARNLATKSLSCWCLLACLCSATSGIRTVLRRRQCSAKRRTLAGFAFGALVLLGATPASASTDGDSTALVLGSLALILVLAKGAGHLAAMVRQPPVLGELLAGIALGNLSLLGWHEL